MKIPFLTFANFFARLSSIAFCCLIGLNAHALNSQVTISCLDSNDVNTCSIQGVGSASEELVTFAAHLIDTASNYTSPTDSSCYYDPNSNTVICNLSSNYDKPLNMTCTQPTQGALSCTLDNEPTAFYIQCDSNSSPQSCQIATNTDALTKKLYQLNPVLGLNPNLISMANSLVTCLNRNTFSSETSGNVASPQQSDLIAAPDALPQPSRNDSLQDICQQFIYDLNSNPEEALALLKALQPLNPDAPSDQVLTKLRSTLTTLQTRLYHLRNNLADTDTTSSSQYWVNNEWHKPGTLFANADNISNDASGTVNVEKNISKYGKLGFFLNAAIINSNQKKDGVKLGNDSRDATLTLGVDYRFTDHVVGGVAFNIDQAKSNFDGNLYTSGSLDSDGYSVILYGTYYNNNAFVDGSVTLGGEDYKQTRDPALLGNSYEAQFHGDLAQASVTGGYDFTVNSFNFTPFAQITSGNISIDGYHETAANPLGPNTGAILALNDQTRKIGTFNIGSYFRYIATTQRGVFIPLLSLTYYNDYKDDAQVVTGRFIENASPNSSFQLQTHAIDSSYFVIGLGFSFQLKGGNSGFVNIESVQGYDNLSQERLTAGWRWEI